MAWNEPGKGQDPWGGGNKNNGSGPPDLDQLWRNGLPSDQINHTDRIHMSEPPDQSIGEGR